MFAQTSAKGRHKLCSCLPEAVLTAPFTNNVRKRRSFSDVNSWHSYEQCLFFSCFVCSVHVNMGVRMKSMPVGLASTPPSPLFVERLCVRWVQRPLLFLNMCMHRSFSKSLLTTLNATILGRLGCSVLELTISTKDSKHLGGLDPAKVFWDRKYLYH